MKYDIKPNNCCCSQRVNADGYNSEITNKLNVTDYLADLPKGYNIEDFVEVQFKNTRKGYYLNSLHLDLCKGDMVAVESSPGHDIGEVTLTGKLVELQMRKARYRHPNGEPRRVYRIAKSSDIELYNQVKELEEETMIRSRKIAEELGLEMKIGDVEYQADGQKAIFYYIAEGRVDFRQLIKKLAETFRIRIEMKQIGVRQEAGRIGGIGPCGRQLCCSAWMSNFVSVGTNSARLQDLSLNPQKLAGQCAKLKCCLNYEVDTYFEAQHEMPSKAITLKTSEGDYRFVKWDLLAGLVTYQLRERNPRNFSEPLTISKERAFEIIEQNNKGKTPFSLLHDSAEQIPTPEAKQPKDILEEESLSRFDSEKRANKRRRNRKRPPRNESNTKQIQNDKVAQVQKAAQEGANRRRRREPSNNNRQGKSAQARPNRSGQQRSDRRKSDKGQ